MDSPENLHIGIRYTPVDIGSLVPTEQVNPLTLDIDALPTMDVLTRINEEDKRVAFAVQAAIPQIALMVDQIVEAFSSGGRLFYVGAGTSGRLGVLDASECPPTFGVDADLVQGIIAGGDTALRNAVEGAEDSAEAGQQAILDLGVKSGDVVIGLSASGGAAYVVEAIQQAKALGASTGAITCVLTSKLAEAAEIAMVAEVGPEALTGSSRMKAGTAQKLILNMLTTGAMIRWGKTYRNLMVDLKPTNLKLQDRSIRIVSHIAGCSREQAEALLKDCAFEVKAAIVMSQFNLSPAQARERLQRNQGHLRKTLEATSG